MKGNNLSCMRVGCGINQPHFIYFIKKIVINLTNLCTISGCIGSEKLIPLRKLSKNGN